MSKLVLIFGLSLIPFFAIANDQPECAKEYCIFPGSSASVVYYFHGAGGGLANWPDPAFYTMQIREYWRTQNLETPTVVAVSYGRWLFASPNSSPHSGLFEDFENRLRPEIEAKLTRKPSRRLLLGESMGAFNALQLSLRTDHYAKAAILCAVMDDNVGPFASTDELKKLIQESLAYKYAGPEELERMLARIRGAMKLARAYFPTPEEWAPFDPMNLAKTATTPTEFYLASGLHDEFASYEANEKFAGILRDRGIAVDWRPQWGGHCAVDIPSLARFLVD